MEAIINSLSEHLNSAVFVLLVVLAVSYWLVYWVVHKVSTLEELLKQRRGELIRPVEEFNPQDAYDLQQACFAVVEQKLESNRKSDGSNCAV